MRIKISDLLYKILLSLLILDAAFYNTTLEKSFKDTFHETCLIIVLILAVFCIFFKKYTKKFLLFNVVILAFALISYKISGNSDIFTSILLVMLAWKMNLDDILKIIFNIRFVVFCLVVLLSLVGVLDAGTIATSSADKSVLLGYGHANTFAGSAGILIFLMFAIHRNKIRSIHYFIAIIADVLIFYFSRSRTSLLLITLMILMILSMKSFKSFNDKILKMSMFILPVLLATVFSLVIIRAKGVAPHFMDIVDKIMNGRILLAYMNLIYYPVTLLGQKVDISIIASSNMYYALDNGFVYILVHYGIVGMIVIAGLQQWAIMHCVKIKESILCVISMLVLCWMMYEGMMISATSNFTLLFSVAMINNRFYKDNQKGKLQ